MNAFIVPGNDNRPSGQGYVLFDTEEAQLAALKVRLSVERAAVLLLRFVLHGQDRPDTPAVLHWSRCPARWGAA
jgi:hypothetical protein